MIRRTFDPDRRARGGPAFPLELRFAEDGVLQGSFRYGDTARISAMRREKFLPGAFASHLAGDPDIRLLLSHDINRPLATTKAGTLEIHDSPQALSFKAQLPPEDEQPGYMQDAVKMVRQGLLTGLSPGFYCAPGHARTRDGVRVIHNAMLGELSLVTLPAYESTSIEARELRRVQLRARRWL